MKNRPILPYEHYEDFSSGVYACEVLDGSKIEGMLIEATREWAVKTHRELNLPLQIKSEQQLPKGFNPQRYKEKDYLPLGIYLHMELGRAATNSDENVDNLDDSVDIGYHFMEEVHAAMKREIFMEFVPNYSEDRDGHPDSSKMPTKECLEYAKDKARQLSNSPCEIRTGDRRIIKGLLEERPWAEWYFKFDILKRTLDKLYRK